MNRISYITLIVFSVFVLVVISPLAIQFVKNTILNSPDANSNYIFVKSYSQTGKLFVSNEYLDLDKYNMFHFRSGITYEDKIVPISFLGLPIVYGTFYNFLGDYIVFINFIFGFLILFFLYKIYLTTNKRLSFFITGILLSIPVLYYLAHSFMNILPTLAFWILGIYYFILYAKQRIGKNMFFSVLFFSFAIIFRYEFLIYSGLVIFFISLNNLAMFKERDKLFQRLLIIMITFFMVFGVILIANYLVYGSPFTTGSDIFQKVYFPERISESSNIFFKIFNILIPNFDLKIVLFNSYKYLFYFNPLFFCFGIFGLFMLLNKKRSFLFMIGLFIAIFYLLTFQGSANVWGSSYTWGNMDELNPSLDHSMIRYWIPIYLFFPLLFGICLERFKLNRKLIMLIIFMIIITSIPSLVSNENVNAFSLAGKNNQKFIEYTLFFKDIPKDSIFFCSLSDKYIDKFAIPFTWWNGKEKYNSEKISDALTILYDDDVKNLYIYRENEVNIDEINFHLHLNNLTLLQKPDTRVYKVVYSDETNN